MLSGRMMVARLVGFVELIIETMKPHCPPPHLALPVPGTTGWYPISIVTPM